MRYFHKTHNQFHRPIVNLDKIWTLVGEEVRNKYKNTEKVAVIDALQHGFHKVLAKGRLPEQPVIVRTKFVSRRAEEKIKAAGGGKLMFLLSSFVPCRTDFNIVYDLQLSSSLLKCKITSRPLSSSTIKLLQFSLCNFTRGLSVCIDVSMLV
jgi:large subunit ribosomal protein L27Ae